MRWLFITLIVLISCNTNNKSKIEVRKLNVDSFQSVLKSYKLINVDTPTRADFYYAFHYVSNTPDSVFINMLKDSLNNIVSIRKFKNGKTNNEINLFVAEYFPNGQIKGDVPLNKEGEPEGLATYYYEDGRIRSIGHYKGMAEVGEWKYYDKDGNLLKKNPNSN